MPYKNEICTSLTTINLKSLYMSTTRQIAGISLGERISGNSALMGSLATLYKTKYAARSILQSDSRTGKGTKSHKGQSLIDSGEKCATSQEVALVLDNFSNSMSQIKKSTDIGRSSDIPKAKTLNQITAADLVMIPIQAQAPTTIEETNANDGDLDESVFFFDYSHCNGKPLQAQVAELRQHPEMLRKFQEEVNATKLKQILNERDRQNRLRMLHREKMMRSISCSYAAKPIIENFPAYNRSLISQGFYSPETQYIRTIRQAEALDAHICEIYDRRDCLNANILEKKLMTIRRATEKPILPQTFIKQRTELGQFIYFTARLALLFQVATNFCEIRMNNDYMTNAAITIQYTYRVHSASLMYKKIRASTIRIQRASLVFLNRLRRQKRLKALACVKRFLLCLYLKNTWPGAAITHINSCNIILRELQAYKARKMARLELIVLLLKKIDHLDTFSRIRNTRYQAHLREVALEMNGKKKPGDGIKKPPVQQPLENFNPSIDEVTNDLLSSETLLVIARVYLTAAIQYHRTELEATARKNANNDEAISVFLLLPSYACSSALLKTARENLPEFRVMLTEYLNTELDLLELGPRVPEDSPSTKENPTS